MFKYAILAKGSEDVNSGNGSFQAGTPTQQTESATELIINRLGLICYLKEGKINKDTTIVTLSDRFFLYENIFKNVQAYNPSVNYEIIRQQQRNDAYSKGQIPSDRIVGISPLLLVPAAYMLMNGLPGKPEPLQPHLTEQEVNQIHRKFLEKLKQGR